MLLLVLAFFAGGEAKAIQYAYRVNFTDKNNTPYSLSSPSAYLSPRALARRSHQGIAIDSTDIPVSAAYLDSVLTLTGGTMHVTSRWFNFCVILVADSVSMQVLDGKPYIQSRKLVGYYAGMLHRPAASGTATGNPAQKTTAGDAAYYGQTWEQTNIVKGNYVHDNGFTGTDKLIAVVDAGYIAADTHPGFSSMWADGRMVDKRNFTLATDFIYGYDDHGTKVLATMAGYVPGTYVGSAPKASYALYVTEDGNSEQPIELINLACATERADSIGADIVTTSLGYNTFNNPADDLVFATDLDGKTTVCARAANMATSKGMLFVASAGNEGGNSWNRILTPGDADSALTIGSVDGSGNNAPNSGYGPNAAGQIKPDVCALGQTAAVFNTVGGYSSEGGTSFSTPQVAGWAACLWQGHTNATPYNIRQAIIKCASSYNTPGTHIGYGIPNFRCTSEVLTVNNVPQPFSPSNWVIAAPNPFNSDLKISVSQDTDQYVDMSIIDITGKTELTLHQYFYKGNSAPVSISLSALPAGIYILKAVSATRQQILRIEKL